MKKVFVIMLVILLILSGCTAKTDNSSFDGMDYRTDIEPVEQRFAIAGETESVYWKARMIGESDFGPSSYQMVVFVNVSDFDEIASEYEFTPAENDPLFPDGTDPTVTGFSQFDWRQCKIWSDEILAGKYVGEVYFDLINGLIYINAENL